MDDEAIVAHQLGRPPRAVGLRARGRDPRRARRPLARFRLLRPGLASAAVPPVALEQTRREWELGHRRLEQQVRDTPRGNAILAELDAVVAELRKRIGGSFTLAELADAS